MSINTGDKVLYKTPMMRTVLATVVKVTDNEENPDEPLLDLAFIDPTFNLETTVHEIEAGTGMFAGSPHTWTVAEAQEDE